LGTDSKTAKKLLALILKQGKWKAFIWGLGEISFTRKKASSPLAFSRRKKTDKDSFIRRMLSTITSLEAIDKTIALEVAEIALSLRPNGILLKRRKEQLLQNISTGA
jgi:hypothetical protein